MYYWIAESTDNSYREISVPFKTKKEAYENMRNSALERVKCNTQFEDIPMEYIITFSRDNIKQISYCGEYFYRIVKE